MPLAMLARPGPSPGTTQYGFITSVGIWLLHSCYSCPCGRGAAGPGYAHRLSVKGRFEGTETLFRGGAAPRRRRGVLQKTKNVSIPLGRRLVALDGATLMRSS